MHLLPNRNNTNFPKAVYEALKKIEKDKKDGLRYQQRLVHEYVMKYPFCRGILAYHKMGSGKTILAVSLAESLKNTHKVIVLSSRTLQGNFRKDIIKYNQIINPNITLEEIEKNIEKDYHFISTKNVATVRKVISVNIQGEELSTETLEALKSVGNIDNTVIIIDEAHNLFNGVTSGSKSDTELYHLIMKAKNIKVILLTGSPIVNTPLELRVAFNLLTGYGPRKSTLMGNNNQDFYDAYIDSFKNTIKNKCKFQNRIFGLVSYYGAEDAKIHFPREKKTKIIRVKMSKSQYIAYTKARAKEKLETASKFIKKNDEVSMSSSYRVNSRQISNFLYPQHAIDEVTAKYGVKQEKNLYKITNDDLDKLNELSPKILELLKNIEIEKGKGLIYSQFVTSGIGIIARCLEVRGYTKIEHAVTAHQKGYGIISGEVEPLFRQELINIFNSDENKNGELMKILLITSTGAEGIDLKAVRHVHVLEPYWNDSRIQQIFARAIRSGSHISLPEEERDVQPYIYLSDYPSSVVESQITEPTTDIYIFQQAIKGQILIKSFLQTIEEVSIECAIFHEKGCRLCTPTNEELFIPDFRQDLYTSDPCKPLEKNKIKVQEILVGDEKYYYSVDTKNTGEKVVHIFVFDKILNGYIEIFPNHENYSTVLNAIYEKEKIKPRSEYII